MKKILLMAVVMLASVASYAQQAVGTFTLQPKIGMNVASLTKCDGCDRASVSQQELRQNIRQQTSSASALA